MSRRRLWQVWPSWLHQLLRNWKLKSKDAEISTKRTALYTWSREKKNWLALNGNRRDQTRDYKTLPNATTNDKQSRAMQQCLAIRNPSIMDWFNDVHHGLIQWYRYCCCILSPTTHKVTGPKHTRAINGSNLHLSLVDIYSIDLDLVLIWNLFN